MTISSEACHLFVKLCALHFVADFLLQPREMGKKKSTHLPWLAGHLLIQWCAFVAFTNIEFATVNMLIHGIIDWNIWRGYKWFVKNRLYDSFGKKWESLMQGKPQHSLMSDEGEWRYWEDHWFYATIGFDQLLHAITLTYLAEKFL